MAEYLLKVVHIHTDKKFISESSKFKGTIFDNYIVLFSNSPDKGIAGEEGITILKPSPKSIKFIVDFCKDSDLVVLYDLESLKSIIACALPKHIPVAWRFFGQELYCREIEHYLSEKTLQTFSVNPLKSIAKKILDNIHNLVSFAKWGNLNSTNFKNTLDRIDLFLCFSSEEFQLFKHLWVNPPYYISLPISDSIKTDPGKMSKKKHIIIGNNRSSYNNNLDIIDIIESSLMKKAYTFIILFNYGNESNYSRAVRSIVKGNDHYKLVNDFLSLDEFFNMYRESSAAVFNGYRQMALGNIFASIQYGLKLYLNEKNLIKHWLNDKGIVTYSVSDLESDLKEGNVYLSEEKARENREHLKKLIDSYTDQDFQLAIHKFLKSKKNLGVPRKKFSNKRIPDKIMNK